MKVIALEKYKSKHHLFRIKHCSGKKLHRKVIYRLFKLMFFHMLKNMHLVLEKHVFL